MFHKNVSFYLMRIINENVTRRKGSTFTFIITVLKKEITSIIRKENTY